MEFLLTKLTGILFTDNMGNILTEPMGNILDIYTLIGFPNRPCFAGQERGSSTHPFQKPELLLRTLIKTYSNENDTILDNFAGSASALIAAWRENRRSVGFEINRDYYDEAVNRIRVATNQGDFFQNVDTKQTQMEAVL